MNAQKTRALDGSRIRPNNATVRGEGKKEKLCSGQINQERRLHKIKEAPRRASLKPALYQ